MVRLAVPMRLKKIDIFILKSFLLLFSGTFFLCLFLFLMNILWQYVDVMVGKGLALGVLADFFFQSALTLVPVSLPLAVLLAALITFGNFGERYELLSMKTAGISLLRVMRPLMILCLGLALVSFYFQNVIGPNASKKLGVLAYSMYQKSPELEIPEGTFYDAISGYDMYVKHKDTKTGMLYDVVIYDVSQGFEKIAVIAADSGRMESTADKGHLYLHLYSGEQFENMKAQKMDRKNNPYRRESFREKHILIEFNSDFNLIDEQFVSSKATSKDMRKIKYDIDSLSEQQDSLGKGNLYDYKAVALAKGFVPSKRDSDRIASSPATSINIDSMFQSASRQDQLRYMENMQSRIRTQQSELSFKKTSMAVGDENIRRHWIEWMKKISLCTSVLVFFFIGAPLGAIIRKGGLGVPVIVSVLTFILYYITSVSGEKLYREGEWGMVGCWLSTIVLLPLSVFFTVSANKDSTVFEVDVYKDFFRHWFGGKVKRNLALKDVVIEDPDIERCSALNEGILKRADEMTGNRRMLPGYVKLFWGEKTDASDIRLLSDDIERLVEELANTRDKVVVELLNAFPVMPVYGVEPPFVNRSVNMAIGYILPLGLLFWVRATLFSAKLHRQAGTAANIASDLKCYLETGKLKGNY